LRGAGLSNGEARGHSCAPAHPRGLNGLPALGIPGGGLELLGF